MADTDDTEPKGRPEEPSQAPVAAENRRARRAAKARGERVGSRPQRPEVSGLDAGERVDDAFSRATDRIARVFKERFNVLQWLIIGLVASYVGWQIYSWRSERSAAKATVEISEALAAELGRIGPPGEEKRDARGTLDTRKAFATEADRLAAAAAAYKAVADGRSGTLPGYLAKLGLAGVLYDQGKYDEASKLYDEVSRSELAKTDPESRGRSLEGLGLCLEAKGDRDGALKRFAELENTEIPGFRELGLYDQARVLHAKGDDAGAKERLKKVIDKLGKDTKADEGEANYLLEASKDLLQRIDPSAVPPPSSEEALQKALQEFQKKLPPGMAPIQMPRAPGSP